MNKKIIVTLLSIFFHNTQAAPDPVQLSVWVNEAIVATYTYSYKNYLQDQKRIAPYFTADGWMAYTKANTAAKLPETVQKNLYNVSAVATRPPEITPVDDTHWNANMDLLVLYKNPQFQQIQNLKVKIGFQTAPSGQGVRGYSVNSIQSTPIKPPCDCAVQVDGSDSAKKNNGTQ